MYQFTDNNHPSMSRLMALASVLGLGLMMISLICAFLLSWLNQGCLDAVLSIYDIQHEYMETLQSINQSVNPPTDPSTEHMAGFCCLSLLTRILLISTCFGNAILLSFLLCSRDEVIDNDVEVDPHSINQSIISFEINRRQTRQQVLSLVMLAATHFLYTAGLLSMLLAGQSHIDESINHMTVAERAVIGLTYAVLAFDTCALQIYAVATWVIVTRPETGPLLSQAIRSYSARGFGSFDDDEALNQSINQANQSMIIVPDPATERELFHRLPVDPLHSLSYYTFAQLPSRIIECCAPECLCHSQRADHPHICKEMDESAVEERIDRSERAKVETFHFPSRMIVSTAVPSYSPRLGPLAYASPILTRPINQSTNQPINQSTNTTARSGSGLSTSLPNLSHSRDTSIRLTVQPDRLDLSADRSDDSASPIDPSTDSACQCVCAICLVRFNAHAVIKDIPCNHRYHITCLRQWAARRSTCPLCRAPLAQREPSNSLRSSLAALTAPITSVVRAASDSVRPAAG